MEKSNNARLGSTRRKMTKEEQQWLQDFNCLWGHNDQKAGKKLLKNSAYVSDVIMNGIQNAQFKTREDVMNVFKQVDFSATDNSGYGDPSSNPERLKGHYTPEDYQSRLSMSETELLEVIDLECTLNGVNSAKN